MSLTARQWHITFQGAPFLFIGDDLNDSGPITTEEDFREGRVSFAHYYPESMNGIKGGIVKRYNEIIGSSADIVLLWPAHIAPMSIGEVIQALDNMLGGDPNWFTPPNRAHKE